VLAPPSKQEFKLDRSAAHLSNSAAIGMSSLSPCSSFSLSQSRAKSLSAGLGRLFDIEQSSVNLSRTIAKEVRLWTRLAILDLTSSLKQLRLVLGS
jgi:hypothetical protein